MAREHRLELPNEPKARECRLKLRNEPMKARPLLSTPSLDSIPPYQPQPFVQASFGPLPVGPPAGAELCIVASRSHRKGLPVNLVAEDAERAASVVVRCDDQDSCAFFARQAFFHVVRFLPGREPLNRTNLDRGSLRQILNVFLGQLDL